MDKELKDELIDKNELENNDTIQWFASPAITLIRKSICPKCGAENSFVLQHANMSDLIAENGNLLSPQLNGYIYKCSSCGWEKILKEPISSIIYVDKDAYEKEVERTGCIEVKGEYQ